MAIDRDLALAEDCPARASYATDLGTPAVPYTPAPCSCYSCDRQCGGSNDPAHGSCGPLAEVDGRQICESCRELGDVYDDHRTGVKVSIDQDRVRTRVVFGESAWLDPAAARHLAAVLTAQADKLDRDRAREAEREADAAQTLAPAGTVLNPCPACGSLPSLITGGGQPPRVGPACGHAEASIYPVRITQ
jgi:hypothetical protein